MSECVKCAGQMPTGPRIDETHVGVRFGDRGCVVVDGDHNNRVVEACGSEGWAIVVNDPPQLCPGSSTNNHARHSRITGVIELRDVHRAKNARTP